jgi:hypothetical protein
MEFSTGPVMSCAFLFFLCFKAQAACLSRLPAAHLPSAYPSKEGASTQTFQLTELQIRVLEAITNKILSSGGG